MAIEITDGEPLATKQNQRKTRLQLQVSNCRRMLRRHADRVASSNDPDKLKVLEAMLRFEQKLFRIENGMDYEVKP